MAQHVERHSAARPTCPTRSRTSTIPTLIVYADGDCDIFPSEQHELLAKSGAADKTLMELPYADHYLYPVGDGGSELADPRERLIDMIVPWIEERLGAP